MVRFRTCLLYTSHLFFLTSDNGNERLVSIYDKRSKKLLQVSGIQCDTDFIFDFIAGIHAYEDYFIAMILPQSLRMLKSQLEKNHYPVKEENMRLFENVKEAVSYTHLDVYKRQV